MNRRNGKMAYQEGKDLNITETANHQEAHVNLNTLTNRRYPDGHQSQKVFVVGTNTGANSVAIVQKEVTLSEATRGRGILIETPDAATGKLNGASQNKKWYRHFYPGTKFVGIPAGVAADVASNGEILNPTKVGLDAAFDTSGDDANLQYFADDN